MYNPTQTPTAMRENLVRTEEILPEYNIPHGVFHPKNAERSGLSTFHTQAAAQHLERISNNMERLMFKRANRKPGQTQFQQLKDLDADYQKILSESGKGIDEIKAGIQAEKERLAVRRKERLNIRRTEFDAEIRKIIRDMSEADRHTYIRSAVENGDQATLNALWDVPGITVGLPDADLDLYRKKAVSIRCADVVAEEKALDAARDSLDTAFGVLLDDESTILGGKVYENYRAIERRIGEAEKEMVARHRY